MNRLRHLATLHPLPSADSPVPQYRLFADGGNPCLEGHIDSSAISQLPLFLNVLPPKTGVLIDLANPALTSRAPLASLRRLAEDGVTVTIRGDPAAIGQFADDDSAVSHRTRIVPHRTTPAAVHRANGFFTGMLESTTVSFDLTLAAVECAPQVAAALDDPASVLPAAERQALTRQTGYLPYGLASLRAAIARMLTTRHDLATAPDQVVITTGAQQALDLLIRCEVAPGQPAVAEDPTFPGTLDALRRPTLARWACHAATFRGLRRRCRRTGPVLST